MKCKRLCIILLSVLLALSIVGCAEKTEIDTTPTCTAICQNVIDQNKEKTLGLDCDTLCGYKEEQFAEYFDYLYGIEMAQITDGCILYVANGTSADEISLLKPVDAGKGAVIGNALQQRIERRIRDYTGYNDREVAKLQNATVTTIGPYMALIIAKNPETTAAALRNMLK